MKELDWNNITILQYNEIQKIHDIKDDMTKMAKFISVFFNVDMETISMEEVFVLQAKIADFLNTKPEMDKLHKTYKVGQFICEPISFDKMTMAQFMDYQEMASKGEDKIGDIMAISLVPKGHKYNDGYDMDKFKTDIMKLPITSVPAVIGFFRTRLSKYYKHFLSCLTGKIIMDKGMTWKQKKALIKTIPTMLQILDTLITA